MTDYGNSVKKMASYKKCLRFNLHFKHNGVVSASLCLHSVVYGKNAEIMKRVEKALLRVRIGQTVREMKSLVAKTEVLIQNIYQLLPSNRAQVKDVVACAQLAWHTEVK